MSQDNTSGFSGFQVKCAIFNAYCELKDSGVELTVEETGKLGKAIEIVTGQAWYGFVNKLLSGAFDSWERKSYGHRLGKGIAGMYRKLGAQ